MPVAMMRWIARFGLRSSWLVSGVSISVLASTGVGRAQAPIIEKVVGNGDPAPVSVGGTFDSFGGFPSLNDAGDVVFRSYVSGGTPPRGLFVASGGVITPVALEGETAPGTGGGTYSSFPTDDLYSIDGDGDVGFHAYVSGGTGSQGIFLASGGTDRLVVLTGLTAPDTGGGTFSSFGPFPSFNDSGDVAFQAFVSGGTSPNGIFAVIDATLRAIALRDDPAPGGDRYGNLPADEPVSINESGDVAFNAVLNTGFRGIFVDSGGTDRAVARRGDVAPGTGSGNTFTSLQRPSINDDGDVAFLAFWSGTTSGNGIFAEFSGSVAPVALVLGAAPDGHWGNFLDSYPFLDPIGRVNFRNPATPTLGIFWSQSGLSQVIARIGDPAPADVGGTFSNFLVQLPIGNLHGETTFPAAVSGGSIVRGIFVTRRGTPAVPALSPATGVLIVLLLFAAGVIAAQPASRHRRG